MNIKKKSIIILTLVIFIVISFSIWGFYTLNNKKKKLENEVEKLTNLLKIKNTIDSNLKKTENERENQRYFIKYLTKEVIKDSIIFINSDNNYKEQLFSKYTDN